MPQRVKDIRVLLAELQRIASHLIWIGTHAMEIGAVSMLFYAVRERELLLNINELIAGFRFFPSYFRIGGLREDLPRGFHEAVNAFLERFPGKIDEFEGLLTKNDIFNRRTAGRRRGHARKMRSRGGWSGRSRAAAAPITTSASTSRTAATRPTTSTCRRATEGDVFARYQVRVAEMRESVKICQQAIKRITPSGVWACDDPRVVPPPKDKVYTRDGSADSALPDLLAGLYGAGRRCLRADRRPARRARLLRRLGRHQPAVAGEDAAAVVHGDSGAADRSSRAA